MRTVVCVKQVRVLGDEVAVDAGATDVDPEYVDFALNEWDAYAAEEALRVRDAHGGEVVVVTCGEQESEAALRRCLAMGADRGARVQGAGSHDPIGVARALAEVVREESPDLVLCGVQSSDSVHAATGTALAELLGLPCVAVVVQVELGPGSARVRRELEGGLIDVVEVELPAVLTIQTGINEPRYANLRAIKQAEQVEVPVRAASSSTPASRVRRMFAPARGDGAEMLGGDPAEVARRIAEIVRERAA
jgi:electron transfer flavoprotein beta subunit